MQLLVYGGKETTYLEDYSTTKRKQFLLLSSQITLWTPVRNELGMIYEFHELNIKSTKCDGQYTSNKPELQ